MAKVVFDSDLITQKSNEYEAEFSFWNIITGMFGDMRELSERINEAIEEAEKL